ncbi:MAG: VOC family protein, partial [Rhodospirillales bacterium]
MSKPLPYPVTDRQTPDAGKVFFDHVAWMVADMDAASTVFERLGFTLTDYSVHGNRDPKTGERIAQGTANRLAMMNSGYIELLSEVGGIEAPVVDDLRARLGRYAGVHLLAFSDADADKAYERIAADGFRLQPMVHLRRDVEAADGSDAEVKFSVIRAAFDEIPEGRIQVLTHHTPELMW